MNIEILREYCISREDVEECFPFGDDTLVFKTGGKIFALANLDGEPSVNLKCDPRYAVELRESYTCVQPGYHMNKKHWNTIILDGSVKDQLIFEWIDHSYNLVTKNKKAGTGQAKIS
ncbi:MAG TPA: MmcQ/YjbR family DNA-binding protein [Bacteroidales bacterium]|nr:MmcQ/YjbR family DNA-binding protein [Bacteroidales bacterium]